MSSVQKKTPKKEKEKRSKVGKKGKDKKERKDRKDGKRKDGKGKKSKMGKTPKKGGTKGHKKGAKTPKSGGSKSKGSKEKVGKEGKVAKPKRSPPPPAAPSQIPLSPPMIREEKIQKVEEKKAVEVKKEEKKESKKEKVPKTVTDLIAPTEPKISEKREKKKSSPDKTVEKKEESKVEPKTEKKAEAKMEMKVESKGEPAKKEEKTEPKTEPKTETKAETKTEQKTEVKADAKTEAKQPVNAHSGSKSQESATAPAKLEKKKSGSESKKKKEEEEKRKTEMKGKEVSPEVKTPEHAGPPFAGEDGAKKDKSRSLKETQSYDSPGEQQKQKSLPQTPIRLIMKTDNKPATAFDSPNLSENSNKIPKNLRSDLDAPLLEEGFMANHGDTHQYVGMKKVDIDLIGRTGMYMERGGLAPEKKQAFDWIAYNRHDLSNKQTAFSQNLAVALGDVGIGKQLAMRTLVYLKSHNQITPIELDKVLKEIHKGPAVFSFSQLSAFMRKHCETYKVPLVQPPAPQNAPGPQPAPAAVALSPGAACPIPPAKKSSKTAAGVAVAQK